MAGGTRAGAVSGRPDVCDVDAALAELERAWAGGGYRGFCVLEHGVWSVIGSSGPVLTGPMASGLDRTDMDA